MSLHILLVGGDLIAQSRLSSATETVGGKVKSASVNGMLGALRTEPPDVLILDLDSGREAVLTKLAEARSEGLAPKDVVGYFSHIDSALGKAATDAGCRALPRGKFWSSLTELIRAWDQ